jgi:hypothetical protein
VLEQKWGGTLLVSLKVILQEALRMRWCGRSPTVKRLHGEYAAGVRLTRTQMKPYEKRLQRSQTLPKYDITITPIQSTRQVVGVSDLVPVSPLDEHQRALAQLDPLAIHDRHAGAGEDVEPLVRAAVAVLGAALGFAGPERHLGGLAVPVA